MAGGVRVRRPDSVARRWRRTTSGVGRGTTRRSGLLGRPPGRGTRGAGMVGQAARARPQAPVHPVGDGGIRPPGLPGRLLARGSGVVATAMRRRVGRPIRVATDGMTRRSGLPGRRSGPGTCGAGTVDLARRTRRRVLAGLVSRAAAAEVMRRSGLPDRPRPPAIGAVGTATCRPLAPMIRVAGGLRVRCRPGRETRAAGRAMARGLVAIRAAGTATCRQARSPVSLVTRAGMVLRAWRAMRAVGVRAAPWPQARQATRVAGVRAAPWPRRRQVTCAIAVPVVRRWGLLAHRWRPATPVAVMVGPALPACRVSRAVALGMVRPLGRLRPRVTRGVGMAGRVMGRRVGWPGSAIRGVGVGTLGPVRP